VNLSGRTLATESRGDEVKLLQSELALLGLTVPQADAAAATFGVGTEQAVMAFQRRHERDGLKITGVVDELTAKLINEDVAKLTPSAPQPPTPPAPTPLPPPAPAQPPGPVAEPLCVVRGTIRKADATPLVGARVVAFDQRIAGPKVLGDTATGDNGTYSIGYLMAPAAAAGPNGAYLFVRVLATDGSVAAESPLVCNAACESVVDLMLGGGRYAGPSEFESISAAIAPFLEDIAVQDLSKDQVVLLSCRTGLNRGLIQLLVWAVKRGHEQQIPAEALYGYARAGLPTALPALVGQSPAVRRNALERALADNRIPLTTQGRLDAIEQSLQAAAVRLLGAGADQPAKATVRAVLAAAGLSSDEQQKFLTQQVASRGSAQALWAAVATDPTLAPKAARIQLAIQVAAITRNHAPLINAILQAQQGTLTTARDLARLPLASWQTLIAGSGVPDDVPGADAAAKAANYAATIVRTMEVLYPTTVFAARLKADMPRAAPALSRFFDQNPDFEMRDTHVDAYLAAHDTALAGVEKPDELVRNLRRVQRVIRLTPRYDDVQRLMEDGLDSAGDIVQRGRAAFLAAHGDAIGPDRATDIFDRARQVAAVAAMLFARHARQMNAIDLRVTANPTGSGA